MPARIVNGADSFELVLGRKELPHKIQREALNEMSVEQNCDVLLSLPDGPELRGQLKRSL